MIPMPTWTPEVWTLLGPLIALCLGGCVMMALDLVPAAKRWPIGWLALVPLAAAAWMLSRLWEAPLAGAQQLLGGALRVDGLAIFTSELILAAAALALVTADRYLAAAENDQRAEFHALALFAVAGMVLLVSADELMTVFLALELLSFPTYVLCAFRRNQIKSNESALKYFVLGTFSMIHQRG